MTSKHKDIEKGVPMFENRSTIMGPLIGMVLLLLLSACEPARVEDVESLRNTLVFTVDEKDEISVKDGLGNTVQPTVVDNAADPIGAFVGIYKDRGRDIQITNGGSSVFFKFIGSACKCKGSGNNVYCVPVGCG